jgi:purine-nucleoside phosphorylase
MARIVQLMDEKNHFLEQFYALGEKTLSEFKAGNFSSLDHFYKTREDILTMIRYVDAQIDGESKTLDQIDSRLKASARESMAVKDGYVSQIMRQDLEILALIEKEKSLMIREMQQVQHAKKAVGGYRVRPLSTRLNEEA